MTVRVTFWHPAEPVDVPGKGEFPVVYEEHAFDGLIGQTCPFTVAGVDQGSATVVAVKVGAGGRGAWWTVDVTDG